MIKKNIFLLVCSTISLLVFAQNPIIESGISDPHVRVFNDTIYLYSGHDATPEDKTWIMKDWRVFSTTDLVNWTYRTTISPRENYMDDHSTECWASDAAIRNGKFYFYFSDQKRGVGVMTSESPAGPFIDALGKPLVAPMHDPTAFIDSDKKKTPYILYGDKAGGGFHIARLNNDMVSIAEEPKSIMIYGKAWEDAPHWMDKSYLFKYEDTYYLSWGRDYATSKNVYGPYQCVGELGNGHNLNELAHGSFFWWKGQFYHVWCYYIKPGYKYRETIISYCHMDEEGRVHTDTHFLDKHFKNGVGQYKAAWDKIEAEWYYEVRGDIGKQRFNDGFVVCNLRDDDWLRFANVSFDEAYTKITARLSFTGKKGTLEIRSGSESGKIIGKIDLKNSTTKASFEDKMCQIKTTKNIHDLHIILKTSGKTSLKLDWIKFE